MKKPPCLFISHGMPTMALLPGPTHEFLKQLGKTLARPRAVICVSAHWEAVYPITSGAEYPETIHDFGPIARELHELEYPAAGDPELAARVIEMLGLAGIKGKVDPERGLDHGAWVPLSLMFPDADIPIIQLSVQTELDPAHHHALGGALAPLRDEGVLIMGSGGATHNLEEIHGKKVDDPLEDYAVAFDSWLQKSIISGDEQSLLDYKQRAPHALRNHPYPAEHFLPLFVPLGAAGKKARGRLLHRDFVYSLLSLAAYAWD